MPGWSRLAIVVAYLALGLGSWPLHSLAQDAGRPVSHHDRGVDTRKAAEADKGKAGEDTVDARGVESESGRAVERAQKDQQVDLTKRSNVSASLDGNQQAEVDSRIEALKNGQKNEDANDLKSLQAEHAWGKRGDSEFRKMGINDAKQLQEYAENVRNHPDIQKELDNERKAYGKFLEEGSKRGTIVIDNPRGGGTIFTNQNIESRMKGLD